MNSATTTSSHDVTKAKSAPARTPGSISGKEMRQKTLQRAGSERHGGQFEGSIEEGWTRSNIDDHVWQGKDRMGEHKARQAAGQPGSNANWSRPPTCHID